MIRTLKAIFETQIVEYIEQPSAGHSLELASAALLLEISRADDQISDDERAAVADAMARVFDLSKTKVDELLGTADVAVNDAISLYDFTVIINEHFTREQKIELIEMLWRVAYADGNLDHYEEYYIRKISDLIHVSHKDYIQTKLRVQTD